MLKDFSGKPLEALTVISQTIGYFKHIAINMIQKSLMNTLVAEDFYFVLTVPAIWDDKQKDLMKKSAIMVKVADFFYQLKKHCICLFVMELNIVVKYIHMI